MEFINITANLSKLKFVEFFTVYQVLAVIILQIKYILA